MMEWAWRPLHRLFWRSELRFVKNCWARELGHAEMVVGLEESSDGIKEPKSWKIWSGV